MLKKFLEYGLNKNLFNRKSRILLAVSGGIDSMVMTDLFYKSGIDTGLAHCNFRLRGAEADLDEELVRNYAGSRNLPFFSISFNTIDYSHQKKISVQMAARELRYYWFEKIRIENNYDLIAVAHNQNDNIETLLINLIRGTGLTGLTGIKEESGNIIRPLLSYTREMIEQYARENKIRYREDKTNSETKYTRNKIRHLVVPLLKEINPSVEITLNETTKRLAAIDRFISAHINDLVNRTSLTSGDSVLFSVKELTDLYPEKHLIYEIFSRFGVNSSSAGDLEKILSGETGKKIITRTHRIIRNREHIIVTPSGEKGNPDYIINSAEDFNEVPGILSAVVIEAHSNFKIPQDRGTACIDFEKVNFPFMIRDWKSGDYFYPLGMSRKKKLSDYFTDRKYSIPQKEKVRILESDGEIVWIVGERLDNRFKVTSTTTKVLLIRLLPG